MAALDRGVLELTADVDDDGSDETGVFELHGNSVLTQEINKDYVFDNTASGLVNLASEISGFELEQRKGFFLDIGGGAHIHEFEVTPRENAVDGDGNAIQWGDGSGSFPADATQDDPLKQIQCFQRYVQLSKTDSFQPATLHVGEYSDGTYGSNGALDPLKVAVQGPRANKDARDDFTSFTLNITCLEVLTLDQSIDIVERTIRGNQQ